MKGKVKAKFIGKIGKKARRKLPKQLWVSKALMFGPKVPLSEKVLRRLCFVTGIWDHVAKGRTIEGLNNFG